MHKLLSNTTASLAQSLFKAFVVVRLTIGLIYLAKICMEEVAKRVHINRGDALSCITLDVSHRIKVNLLENYSPP